MRLYLACLGGFQVYLDGEEVGARLGYAKVRALLSYLVLERGRRHERGHLALLLWPGEDGGRSRLSLRQALNRLRKGLGEGVLVVDRVSAGLSPVLEVETDVGCLERVHLQGEGVGLEAAREALEFYGGEFLEGLNVGGCEGFGEWLEYRRCRCREWASGLALRLAERSGLEGGGGLEWARRAVEIDPWSERARRALWSGLEGRGAYAEAAEGYREFCEALEREYGLEPEAATRLLGERLVLRAQSLEAVEGGLEPERRRVTVLDVRPYAEEDPEALEDALSRLRECSEGVAARHGGWLAPGDGYGAVLWFGYPRADEWALDRALRAAGELLELEGGLAAGIEQGEVVVRGGSACGAVVLVARELSARGAAGTVLLGPGAAERAGPAASLRRTRSIVRGGRAAP